MTTPLQRFLDQGDALDRLQEHAQRLRRMQTLFEGFIAAPLLAGCAVANLKGGTLVILARNGAAAARIRQVAPRLMVQFSQAGIPIEQIQVKVSVENVPARPAARSARVLSDAGRASLASLTASLPDDAPLKASLEALIHRSRRP